MTLRRTAFGAGLLLLAGQFAHASTTDILIGLDEKIAYGPDGQANGPPGKDAVLVMDVSNPAKPKIRASLPLTNSLLGPPTNLQITPDGKLGLVANSVNHVQDGAAWKAVPDDKLYVIDLTANPPKLIDTVTVGKQPSGLAISHKGDLALIGNRAGKSVSVVSIQGTTVKAVGEVPMDNEVAGVAITPDGKRAFAVMNLANKVGVLSIDGTKVSYDKSLDIPSAFNPYNIDIMPDGKFAVASHTGAQGINADAEVSIDTSGAHPHVADIMARARGRKGSPSRPTAVGGDAADRGSGAKPSAWNHVAGGHAALLSVGPGGKLTVANKAPIGALPEGIAFSPNSEYVYIGNYIDKNLQVFRIAGGKLVSVGTLSLPGQPASVRGPAR